MPRKKKPAAPVLPLPSPLTSEQIDKLHGAIPSKLLIDDLNELNIQLAQAKGQLEKQIDELDSQITELQMKNVDQNDPAMVKLLEEQKPLMTQLEYVNDTLEQTIARIDDDQWIVIDGEIIDVSRVHEGCDEYPAMVEEGRRDWYVDESSEEAGKKARERWRSMAENDPKEFTCMVGEKTLCAWALGQWAGPGTTQCRSLEEWLDLHLDHPEEEFGSYDGSESDVDFCSKALEDELGFTPKVAYRHN